MTEYYILVILSNNMNICKVCKVFTEAKKISKQELIYNSALKLFKAHGPRKVSVDMIITEAGVGKWTFYNYYINKEDLYEQMLECICFHACEYVESLLVKYPDPKERFMVDLINSLEFFCDDKGIIRGLMENNPDYLIGKIDKDYLEEAHEKILKILFSDVYSKLFAGDRDLLSFAHSMFKFYKHAQNMKPTFDTEIEFKDFMVRLAYFMVEGIFSDHFQDIWSLQYLNYADQIHTFQWEFKLFKKY